MIMVFNLDIFGKNLISIAAIYRRHNIRALVSSKLMYSRNGIYQEAMSAIISKRNYVCVLTERA